MLTFVDVSLENLFQPRQPNETHFVTVESDECCMKFSGNQYMDCEVNINNITGKYIGLIRPGGEKLITLVLPRLVLFNDYTLLINLIFNYLIKILHDRVGHCDIEIISRRFNGSNIQLFHIGLCLIRQ